MRTKTFLTLIVLGFFVAPVFAPNGALVGKPFSFAQNEENGIDTIGRREELRAQMYKIQQEITTHKEEIKKKQSEEKTLAGEISILEKQVKKTQLELAQTGLALRSTEISIDANNFKIADFSGRIEREKIVISEIMRAIYEEDSRGIVELIMSSGDLSAFFEHQKFLENIQASLYNALQNIKQSKRNIEQQQEELEEEKESQYELKALQEAQRLDVTQKKSRSNTLLKLTREQKREFERIVGEKERDIEQIRNKIFLLEGVGIAIPLHEAYKIAKLASSKTSVRPAFLLAVLKQESSWGKNVGQCFLVDIKTGAGKGKNTGAIYSRTMKASRDVEPFLGIVKELGRDPYNTLVSCPHLDYGYGGAMGPAQFLPSTWIAYKDRLADLLGHTPDPWDINDAFTASALKLANGGAAAQTPEVEWKAAMIYYAGSRWNNSVYSFYGDSVMEIAEVIQEEINVMGE
ncbi:MAG: lytic murein transglycosylase [Candidatus Spechtbacterales bacterium]